VFRASNYMKRQRAHVAIHHRMKRKLGKAQRCTKGSYLPLGAGACIFAK
jgi:hypothetical protein